MSVLDIADEGPAQNPRARGTLSYGREGVPAGFTVDTEGNLTILGTLTGGGVTGGGVDPGAARLGFDIITGPLGQYTNGFVLGAGTAVFVTAHCCADATITKMGTFVSSAAATPNGNANTLAIYSEAGVRLGVTGDMTAAFQATGWREGTLTAPVDIVAGQNYYLSMLTNFGTGPTIVGNANQINPGTVNGHYPTVFLTAQTVHPASFTPSAANANSGEYMMGGYA